jgi:hypothetical protein
MEQMRTWSRNPRPVETLIFWTPGALSRVRVQEMLVSDVSRETVAVRAAILKVGIWYCRDFSSEANLFTEFKSK